MADAWSGSTYKNGNLANGLGGGKMSCAQKIGTREIWWRYDTGDNSWAAAPVLVGTVPGGAPLACHCLLDGAIVIVTNGIAFRKTSTKHKNASFS